MSTGFFARCRWHSLSQGLVLLFSGFVRLIELCSSSDLDGIVGNSGESLYVFAVDRLSGKGGGWNGGSDHIADNVAVGYGSGMSGCLCFQSIDLPALMMAES